MTEHLIEYLHECHPVIYSLLDQQPLGHLKVATDPIHECLFGIHDTLGGGFHCQASVPRLAKVSLDFLDRVKKEGFNLRFKGVVMSLTRLKAIVLVTSLIKLIMKSSNPLVLFDIMLLDIAEDLLLHSLLRVTLRE